MDVRELPAQEPRVETGVVRFGDDWCGVFIRGDSAFMYAEHLQFIVDTARSLDRALSRNLGDAGAANSRFTMALAVVDGLLDTLRSSDERILKG